MNNYIGYRGRTTAMTILPIVIVFFYKTQQGDSSTALVFNNGIQIPFLNLFLSPSLENRINLKMSFLKR
jgi:hypothetical protein